jgi:hypothetical protein
MAGVGIAGAATMIGYSLTYQRPLYAAIGMLNIVGLLSFAYLLFYGALLAPALALYRYLRRTRGVLGAMLGGVLVGILWLCMAVFGLSAADGDDEVQAIGLTTGLFLTILFVIYVNSRLHIYLPCCAACRKPAATSVRITDYFPLKGRAEMQFQSPAYADAFVQANSDDAEFATILTP